MFCPNCNNEIDDNSNFCRFCGFNVEFTEDQSGTMYCHNCGRLIESNSQFCNYCGTKVDPIILEPSLEENLISAEKEFNAQNYKSSLELFCKVYDLDNENEKALFGIIESYFQLEEYENVILYSYKYLKIDETSDEVLNYKLLSEINIGSFSSAKKTINDLLDISKNDIDLLFKKIDILKELNETEGIIRVYDEILRENKDRDDIYFEKSKLQFEISRYNGALKSIDLAIDINPLSEYIIFKSNIEKKLIKKIGNGSLNNALVYFNECNYLFANEIFSKYNDSKSLELSSICLYRLGKNEDALNVVNQLLKISNNAENIDLKAKIYLAMGDEFNSINFFKEAVKLNKKYTTDLAFAYGRFGDIELSKKYYSQVNDKLSRLWLDYYDGSDELLISKLQHDFFNYPHLICLKIDMYLRNSVSFFNKHDLKKTLKYLKLSEKYLYKLDEFIKEYKLNNYFVASNFIYIGRILENYKLINFGKLKHADKEIFTRFIDILNDLIKYYDSDSVYLLKINIFLSDFYKSLAISFIRNSKEKSLEYFKKAASFVNSDGETWLYIANLSDENQIVFYNKALFCFNKDFEESNNVKFLKLKGITLYYLNRKKESIDILKNNLPKRYTDEKIVQYINKSMKSYSG